MIGIRLEPVDTWFFRDGTPFSAGDSPQDDVGTLFPPFPATVAGAVRAAMARHRGWNGRGRWPPEFNEVLGDGPENLGALSIDGPFLLRDGQPLFRMPRHLLGSRASDGWTPRVLLRPGSPVACDLGDAVRLPEFPQEPSAVDEFADLKAGNDEWLTQAGMNDMLRGALPDRGEIVPCECLWSVEERIGLERNASTHSAKEGMLYSTRHVRPRNGISLGARIADLPRDWHLPFGGLLSLGGESRLAECREWDAQLAFDAPLAMIKASGRVALIALSPVDIEEAIVRGERPLPDLGGARVVSACLNRPWRIGGWDSRSRRPLPLRCVLPSGSVLFCEMPEPSAVAIAASDGMTRLGSRQEWGFGLVTLGTWPNEQEGNP